MKLFNLKKAESEPIQPANNPLQFDGASKQLAPANETFSFDDLSLEDINFYDLKLDEPKVANETTPTLMADQAMPPQKQR